MKKYGVMLATVALGIMLAGCGANSGNQSNTAEEQAAVVETNENKDTSATDETVAEAEQEAEIADAGTSEEETANVDDTNTEAATESQEAALEEGTGKHKVLDGGQMNDMCLEMINTFIDFSSQNVPELGVRVERRSETNLIVSTRYGEPNQLDVQYSRSLEKVGETKYMEKTFPDGYERVVDPNYGEILYSCTKEEDGTRIVVLQDVGDEVYLSIRMFEKSSQDPLLFIDEFMIKAIPVYWK